MGKTQSKRSVDITTELKKGTEEEVTEKLEKIEDVDQKQVNGDATPQEVTNEAEKKDTGETENEKDLTTEKSAEAATENGDQSSTTATAEAGGDKEDVKEDVAAAAEEISPLADESIKKSKKEKVKKKWSFRSISFGKKDKQKPAKTEEAAENTPVTNGDAEKADTEAAGDAPKAEKCGDEVEAAKSVEQLENGNASDKELNGQKTPTPTEEAAPSTVKSNDTTNTAAAAVSATITTETAIENNQTENKAATVAATNSVDTVGVASNNKPDGEKNGVIESPTVDNDAQEPAAIVEKMQAVTEISVAVESNKTIPCIVNDGHDGENAYQNGTNGEEPSADAVLDQTKSQIENIVNAKDLKENAAAEIITQEISVANE